VRPRLPLRGWHLLLLLQLVQAAQQHRLLQQQLII
jgi:hypothetical protein